MQISILTVSSSTATSATGKPYQKLEVNYKDLGFGKVASKTLLPFGAQKGAFDALAHAKTGDTFNITVVKNDKGYNDWTNAAQSFGEPQGIAKGEPTVMAKPTQVKSTYETPEERAKKQIYIIRQSSISSAVATLVAGAKSAPTSESVFDLATKYYEWVMQDPTADVKDDVFTLPNDLEVD